MPCSRCQQEVATNARGFCPECERDYDGWIRQYASDIVPPAIAAMVIVLGFGLGIPLLGINYLFALLGVFTGFGTFVGMFQVSRRRRRRQFLSTSGLPRAYLPTKT